MNLKLLLSCGLLLCFFSCAQTDTIAKYRKLKRLSSADVLERAKNKQLIYHYAKFKNVHGESLNKEERDLLDRGQLAKDYYIDKLGEIVEVRVRPMNREDQFLEIQVRSLSSYTPQDSLFVAVDCDKLKEVIEELIVQQEATYFNPDNFGGQDTEELRSAFYEESDALRTKNRHLVESILVSCDFPDEKKIGATQMENFLSILRNLNRGLMAYYYPQIKFAMESGKLDKKHFAVIQDRLLMMNGYPQIYGSQILRGGLHRLEDPETVNERRSAVGLRPIEEYLEKQGLNFEEELRQMKLNQS